MLEDVFFPSALEFLFALQFTSRQENESRDMLLWGLESLDRVLENDWDEEDDEEKDEGGSGGAKSNETPPLHVQIKGNMGEVRKPYTRIQSAVAR